mmetsp:Transcript_21531/g.44322  ORF Transcript_21531/g.44322 Transcript_21531/m.44322 type:complete len:659 (+) Transcript_21531:1353-3329(+)
MPPAQSNGRVCRPAVQRQQQQPLRSPPRPLRRSTLIDPAAMAPSNKKKRAAERRAAKKQSNNNGGGATASNNATESANPDPSTAAASSRPPNYCLDPPLHRPIPDMSVHPLEAKRSVLRASPQKVQNNPTLRRFVEAYTLLESMEDRCCSLPSSSSSPLATFLSRLQHVDNVDISLPSSNADYLTLCVDLIRSITLTDWRIGVGAGIIRSLVVPDCVFHITSSNLPAAAAAGASSSSSSGANTDVQLHNVGARQFVVLLAAAIATSFSTSGLMKRASLYLVHELRIHAAFNYDWLDWSDLEQHGVKGSDGAVFTEAEARFALATTAIKVCRSVYRNGLEVEYSSRPGPSKEDLLMSIETFSKDQVRYRPTSGVGFFNQGWVFSQVPAIRGVNALEAAADCFDVMTKAYETADADGDDFVRAAARIEAATCLVMGGGGVVGLGSPRCQVTRDMRSVGAKLADGTIKVNTLPDGTVREEFAFTGNKRCNISSPSPAEDEAILRSELVRVEKGIPPAFLFRDETLLVEYWEVKRLWNQAVQPIDALAEWNHSHFVYGESWGWDAVVRLVKASERSAHNQYANATTPPGFPIKADAGREGFRGSRNSGLHRDDALRRTCNWCGRNGFEFKRCTKCKAVYYCDAVCQKGHWKKGGHKVECKAV